MEGSDALATYTHSHETQRAITRGQKRQEKTRTIASDIRQTHSACQRVEASPHMLSITRKSSTRGGKWSNGLEEAREVKPITESGLLEATIEYCGDILRCKTRRVQNSKEMTAGDAHTKMSVKCRKCPMGKVTKNVYSLIQEPLGCHGRQDVTLIAKDVTLQLSKVLQYPIKMTLESSVIKT